MFSLKRWFAPTSSSREEKTAMTDQPTVVSAIPKEELDTLTDQIIKALKTVYDPEIPADIYELGLIYNVDVDDDRMVAIDMTLTAPGCPVAGEMPVWVRTWRPTITFSSAVISENSRMFWKVRAMPALATSCTAVGW